MITVPWWLPWLAGVGGVGVCALLVTLLIALWMGRIDALVLARVDARTEQLLTLLVEPAAPSDPEPEPELAPASDPWSSWQTLHDGLPEPAAPDLPEHPWLKDPTGPLAILPPPGPDAAVLVAEVVDEEPKPNPRKRFSEPKPATEITVAVVVPDAEIEPEKVSVQV